MHARNDDILAGEEFDHVFLGTIDIIGNDFDAQVAEGIIAFIMERGRTGQSCDVLSGCMSCQSVTSEPQDKCGIRTNFVTDATRPLTTDLPVLPVAPMTTTRMDSTDMINFVKQNPWFKGPTRFKIVLAVRMVPDARLAWIIYSTFENQELDRRTPYTARADLKSSGIPVPPMREHI